MAEMKITSTKKLRWEYLSDPKYRKCHMCKTAQATDEIHIDADGMPVAYIVCEVCKERPLGDYRVLIFGVEVFYSIGDRFRLVKGGDEMILCQTMVGKISLICMASDGLANRCEDPVAVKSITKITAEELNHAGGLWNLGEDFTKI